jgi:predicted small lipoprotein YifL
MNRSLRLAAASLAVILLAACGAKGPLFLPPPPPPVDTVEPATDAPADSGSVEQTVPTDSETPPADSSAPPVTPPAATSSGNP